MDERDEHKLRTKLRDVIRKLEDGLSPTMTVRQLLSAAGAERRGVRVTAEIRSVLQEYNLRTVPDFDEVGGGQGGLDGRFKFDWT